MQGHSNVEPTWAAQNGLVPSRVRLQDGLRRHLHPFLDAILRQCQETLHRERWDVSLPLRLPALPAKARLHPAASCERPPVPGRKRKAKDSNREAHRTYKL